MPVIGKERENLVVPRVPVFLRERGRSEATEIERFFEKDKEC